MAKTKKKTFCFIEFDVRVFGAILDICFFLIKLRMSLCNLI